MAIPVRKTDRAVLFSDKTNWISLMICFIERCSITTPLDSEYTKGSANIKIRQNILKKRLDKDVANIIYNNEYLTSQTETGLTMLGV